MMGCTSVPGTYGNQVVRGLIAVTAQRQSPMTQRLRGKHQYHSQSWQQHTMTTPVSMPCGLG